MSPLPFILGNAWRAACGLLLVGLVIQTARIEGITLWPLSIDGYRAELAECRSGRRLDVAAVREATAEARAADIANALETERRQTRIAQEKQHELEGQLVAARSAVARYVSVQRGEDRANPGGSGPTSMPGAAAPTGYPAPADGTAFVSVRDIEVCAENTTKLEGWQSWWRDVSERNPDDGR